MQNGLKNAGFLDGTNDWQASSGLTLSADEATRGSDGRIVLRGTGTATASGQTRWLSPTTGGRADIENATLVEVSVYAAAFLGGASVTPLAQLVFYNSSGTAISTIDLSVQRPRLPLHGVAVAGLTDTFWRVYGSYPRPANAVRADVQCGVTSTASSQSQEVVMRLPYVGSANVRGRQAFWGPGAHSSGDLNRRNWPSDMPLVGTEGGQPKPWAITHDAGAGLPAQRRVSADPARKLTARVHVDAVQRARLDAFAANEARFWLLEPDTEKLCLASFDAEGAPRLAEKRGGIQHLEVTLWLETA